MFYGDYCMQLLRIILLWSITQFTFADQTHGLTIHSVAPNIYAIVGELGNRAPDNLGNNATFGVVRTNKGLVLIDSGGSYQGAKHMHDVITKQIADEPIIAVINTGGQDHRFFGNGYFKALGAQIISSNNAVADQQSRYATQYARMEHLIGSELLTKTAPVYADTTFDTMMELTFGDTTLELIHSGGAHTPGDTFVWLPKERIVFSGDIVYTTRMLSIRPYSNSKSWLGAFKSLTALNPVVIVPGHGTPSTVEQATKDTYDYINTLRIKVSAFIDEGGDMSELSKVDMSAYDYLLNANSLSGANAQQVYSELEWE